LLSFHFRDFPRLLKIAALDLQAGELEKQGRECFDVKLKQGVRGVLEVTGLAV